MQKNERFRPDVLLKGKTECRMGTVYAPILLEVPFSSFKSSYPNFTFVQDRRERKNFQPTAALKFIRAPKSFRLYIAFWENFYYRLNRTPYSLHFCTPPPSAPSLFLVWIPCMCWLWSCICRSRLTWKPLYSKYTNEVCQEMFGDTSLCIILWS